MSRAPIDSVLPLDFVPRLLPLPWTYRFETQALDGVESRVATKPWEAGMGGFYGNKNGRREVVLSFDDGPDAVNTPKLLDVLAEHRVKAIFFLLGRKLATATGKEILKRIQ